MKINVSNLILTIALISSIMFGITNCTSDTGREKDSPDTLESLNENYDSQLATELGADRYGMRSYIMAFLKTGPNRNQDSITVAELQKAHMANIRRMANEGTLILAGPFLDGGELRGIYLFDVPTIEEARKLTATDPAIQAGRFEMELHPWYGSAALLKISEIHSRISREIP
jgi:uncharacterized protein